jgi:hypothetical protein
MKITEQNGNYGRKINVLFTDDDAKSVQNFQLYDSVSKLIKFSGEFGPFKEITFVVPFFKNALVTIKIENLKWGI